MYQRTQEKKRPRYLESKLRPRKTTTKALEVVLEVSQENSTSFQCKIQYIVISIQTKDDLLTT
jgi:hypothetical protein